MDKYVRIHTISEGIYTIVVATHIPTSILGDSCIRVLNRRCVDVECITSLSSSILNKIINCGGFFFNGYLHTVEPCKPYTQVKISGEYYSIS